MAEGRCFASFPPCQLRDILVRTGRFRRGGNMNFFLSSRSFKRSARQRTRMLEHSKVCVRSPPTRGR